MNPMSLLAGPNAGGGPPPHIVIPGKQSAADLIADALTAVRQAIQAPDADPQEKATLEKVTTLLQQFAATRHSEQQAALGGGPATNFLRRATGG